jgi:hypothetical protein
VLTASGLPLRCGDSLIIVFLPLLGIALHLFSCTLVGLIRLSLLLQVGWMLDVRNFLLRLRH